MRACVVDLDFRQPNWEQSRCGSMKERNHFPTIDSIDSRALHDIDRSRKQARPILEDQWQDQDQDRNIPVSSGFETKTAVSTLEHYMIT